MNWNTFITNEAISNYLVFAAGLFVGGVIHILRRIIRKPAIVQLVKQRETSLIMLSSDAQKRLTVTYQDEPVDDFQVTVFEIRNKTGRTIEDINLRLYLDAESGKQKLYEVLIEDPLENLRLPTPTVQCIVEASGEHYLAIKAPYLNDAKNDNDILAIKIYSPRPLMISRLVGGGKGWMSQFFDRVAFNAKLDRIVRESNSTFDLIINTVLSGILRRWR